MIPPTPSPATIRPQKFPGSTENEIDVIGFAEKMFDQMQRGQATILECTEEADQAETEQADGHQEFVFSPILPSIRTSTPVLGLYGYRDFLRGARCGTLQCTGKLFCCFSWNPGHKN